MTFLLFVLCNQIHVGDTPWPVAAHKSTLNKLTVDANKAFTQAANASESDTCMMVTYTTMSVPYQNTIGCANVVPMLNTADLTPVPNQRPPMVPDRHCVFPKDCRCKGWLHIKGCLT